MPSMLGFQIRVGDDDEDPGTLPDVADAPEGATELGTAPAPLVLLEGDRMSERDQTLSALAHAIRAARRRARDLAEREGGLTRSLIEGHAPSLGEQRRYARARKWTAPGHDGGVLEGMGVIYHATAGPLGTACGQAAAAIAAYPFRACVAAGLTLLGTNVALFWTRHHFAAIMTDLGAAAILALWAGSGWLLMHLSGMLAPARYEDTADWDEEPRTYEEEAG